MVILALLKSNGRTPLQWWTFRDATIISIGRSLSNQVIVRNAQVSRRHCELRLDRSVDAAALPSVEALAKASAQWMLVGKGKNGTFLDGQPIKTAPLADGSTIQLAPKGPILKVYLRDRVPERDEWLLGDLDREPSSQVVAPVAAKLAVNSAEQASSSPDLSTPAASLNSVASLSRAVSMTGVEDRPRPPSELTEHDVLSRHSVAEGQGCDHAGNLPSNLLCIRCGQPLRVMRSVRHYQLLRLLGQGGMGTTFLAWQAPMTAAEQQQPPGQRLVVVKQLNPDVAAIAKAQELFEREAKVLQTVEHPGIPRFLDFFLDEGKAYLAMELIHGKDLEQHIMKQGPVPANQAIEWMQQTCDVLHHLHTQHPPILHRDIKPANLLRQYRDGRIVVVDFGAVKALAGAMGTCIKAEGYTAPEQEEGQPTIASDIFSVAATLVFLVTRQSPLDFLIADDQMSLEGAAQIPPHLRAVLEKAMSMAASARYSSALELKLALGACLDS